MDGEPVKRRLCDRPSDETDAVVADPGDFELELGPAGVRRNDSGKTLIAPRKVLNLRLIGNWQAVLEGPDETPVSSQRDRTDF
jgi:hypothetical protein